MKFAQLSIYVFVAIFAILAATSEAKLSAKIGQKSSGKSTWFDGHDLKGAACYGDILNKDVDAQDSWHIGAMRLSSISGGERAGCFQCAKVTANRRSVIVRIIDDCTSCSQGQIDLTSSAFKILAPLKQGVVKMQFEWVRCPSSGKWPKSPAPK
ncbi:hypothetical protein BGZ54_003499, partial [Gamsiella multidivaricata]